MTATAAPAVKDEELASFGLVESANVNSIADFTPPKSNENTLISRNKNDEFVNTFICHLIFYAVFCLSIVLHILIDLGLGTFIKDKFAQLIGLGKKTFFEPRTAFA